MIPDPEFLICKKILQDLTLNSIEKEKIQNSSFRYLSRAIRELISAEKEGNLCIALCDSPSDLEGISSFEFQSSIPSSELQKELNYLPKGSFVLQDCNFYFQKTFEAKRNLETCFQALIRYTKEYRDYNQSKYGEEEINQILDEIENDWNEKWKKQSSENPKYTENNRASNFRKESPERFRLNKDQRRAILQAIRSPFHIITGGPGTGKTTVVAFLMETLFRLGELPPIEDIALAAPTGRAGQRLTESIQENWNCLDSRIPYREQIKGTTLHRLLRFQTHTQSFYYNSDRSLFYRFVLVDEVSMVDIYLFRSLLLAIPNLIEELRFAAGSEPSHENSPYPFRLILLGDPNQLPPVGKGAVLTDILAEIHATLNSDPELGRILLTHLEISNRFRGENGKKILQLANFVIGKETESNLKEFWLDLKSNSEVFHLVGSDFQIRNASCKYLWEEAFMPQLKQILETNLRERNGILPEKENFKRWNQANKCITIYRKGAFGIEGLQSLLDRYIQRFLTRYSPSKSPWKSIPQISIDNRFYYPGLPLLITQNDSIRKLYNGDTGFVLLVRGELRACFLIDGEIQTFALDTLPEHEEAYFLTVHKSQGSEYENLYFYLPPPTQTSKTRKIKKTYNGEMEEAINERNEIQDEDLNLILVTREILYTGITRARSTLKLIGSKEGWEEGLKNETKRRTGFRLDLKNL